MKLTKEECDRALNNIKSTTCRACGSNTLICGCNCINTTPYKTIEQLINEYFEMKGAYEMYKDIAIAQSKDKVILQMNNNKLEKALDKACEHLSNTDRRITCGEYVETCMDNHCYGVNCVHARRLTKGEWKEYFLNE